MSKKNLHIDGIMNELEGASLFFKHPQTTAPPLSKPDPHPFPRSDPAPATIPDLAKAEPPERGQTPDTDEIDLTTPYNEPESLPDKVNASSNASMQARIQAEKPHDLVKTIRKAVRKVGKEVLYVRLSPTEKHTLGSIVFAFNEMYRGEGYKTSENEIGRIGLNYLLENYREKGDESILARVLASLLA